MIDERQLNGKGPTELLHFHPVPPPLRIDDGGVVRVGKSRVSLDVVVEQYENGITPEDMVRAYDTMALADVHAAIAYYLTHRDDVAAYLNRRRQEAEALRAKIEAERPRVTPEELLARQRPGPGLAKSMLTNVADDDEHLRDFAEYMP